MRTARLLVHPDTPSAAVTGIAVDLVRSPSEILGLRYVVTGRIDDLALPAPAPSRRADRLWEHSCFEAFLRDEAGTSYAELNVSPSSEWAGYRFSAYRTDMTAAPFPAPRVEVERTSDRLEVRVALQLNSIGRRRIGLSAVIEEKGGAKSYWALAHPPGAPDFHHPDCFQIDLPPLGHG
jgi:hypothetical protein